MFFIWTGKIWLFEKTSCMRRIQLLEMINCSNSMIFCVWNSVGNIKLIGFANTDFKCILLLEVIKWMHWNSVCLKQMFDINWILFYQFIVSIDTAESVIIQHSNYVWRMKGRWVYSRIHTGIASHHKTVDEIVASGNHARSNSNTRAD